VESAQDVLEDLRFVLPAAVRPQAGDPEEPEGEGEAPEDPLLAAMGYDPIGLDALIARTGIPAPRLSARLLELELAGEVARLPGGLDQRQASA
jgi:DNA processing protein